VTARKRQKPERLPRLDAGLPLPKRPFRDSLIFYGVLSLLLVLVAYLTNGNLGRAVVFAVGFFVIATGWAWWRFRQKLREQQERA